tara:strand:+ start:1170 stop:2507 length:1338 start_codon:yes stop_codon:yes gene_type:complete
MSGRLQIATRGLQNEWINGTPTQSHFLFSLNKHSKFAFDIFEIPLSETEYDRESICVIPLDAGDLITQMTLRYQIFLKDVSLRSDLQTMFIKNSPALHLIEYVDLFMGGMHIQRLTSEWMDTYNTIQYEKTLKESTRESASFVRAELEQGRDYDSETSFPSVYLNLPFYFNDNLKSAILTCKLTKVSCRVKIKFRKLSDVLRLGSSDASDFFNDKLNPKYGTSSYPSTQSQKEEIVNNFLSKDVIISNASVLTQYAYLDTDELQYLKSRPIEHIITQLQLKRFDVPRGETKRIQLNFKHPVKTLYFFVGPKNKYDVDGEYMKNIRFSNAKLLFNNQIMFEDGPERLIYYNSKTNTMSGVYLLQEKKEIGSYSFALYPLKKELTGHVNFSRIINQEFEISLPNTETITEYSKNPDTSTLQDLNECQIYAESYNILHYSSGLVGLKF